MVDTEGDISCFLKLGTLCWTGPKPPVSWQALEQAFQQGEYSPNTRLPTFLLTVVSHK